MHLDSRRITRGFVTRFLSALECLPFAKTLAHSENTRRAFYSAGEADYNDVQWAHVSIHSSATDDSLSPTKVRLQTFLPELFAAENFERCSWNRKCV